MECELGTIIQNSLWSVCWKKCLQFFPYVFISLPFAIQWIFPPTHASHGLPKLMVAFPSVSTFAASFLPHPSSYSISVRRFLGAIDIHKRVHTCQSWRACSEPSRYHLFICTDTLTVAAVLRYTQSPHCPCLVCKPPFCFIEALVPIAV